MNGAVKEEACPKCGLIQGYDEICGFVICDMPEAQIMGCPKKEAVLKNYPNWKYRETIIERD